MKYRPEIDGLRALAIVSIILFHLKIDAFRGGYVGVDIFFVISGFLITSIIKKEIETNEFSVIKFYARRAQRILPALFLVLILSTIFSWILLPPNEFINYHKSLFSVLFFHSNIFFWRDGDYFVSDSMTKPLLHTWSLAVEEQFYIFFPFILLFIKKLKIKTVVFILLILGLTSLIICIVGSVYFKSANFYLLPSRLWELLIGAIGAILIQNLNKLSKGFDNLFGLLGLVLILAAFIFLDDNTPFPSIYALTPTLGAFLVIVFVKKDHVIGKFLSHKYLTSIGILSYGAYLFHQPIISFYLIYSEIELSNISKITIFFASFLFAYLSLNLIEVPIKNKSIQRNKFFFFSSSLIILLSLYSFWIFKIDNFPFESSLAEKLSKTKLIVSSNMDERKFSKFRLEHLNSKPEILVLGSSRIMQVSGIYLSKDVLNLSVSGASVEDQITLGILSLKKFTPKIVYLAADPWLFNKNSGQIRYQSLGKEYLNSLKLLSSQIDIEMVENNEQRSDSVSMVLDIYRKINLKFSSIMPLDSKPGIYDKIRYDGSRIYNNKYQNLSKEEIRRGLDDLYSYSMLNFKFDNISYNLYKKFIQFLNSKGIKVILVFSPYNPELYQRLKSNRSIVFVQKKINELSNGKSISIIGSYDPLKCNCNQQDFFDGMHPKDDCIRASAII